MWVWVWVEFYGGRRWFWIFWKCEVRWIGFRYEFWIWVWVWVLGLGLGRVWVVF